MTIKCSLWKRFLAAFTDLLIVILLGLGIKLLIVTPIADSNFNLTADHEELSYQQVHSFLYVVVDKEMNIVADGDSSREEILSLDARNNTLASIMALTNYSSDDKYDGMFFYTYLSRFFAELSSQDLVNEYYKDSSLFTFTDGKYVLKDDASDQELLEFCNTVYNDIPKFYVYYQNGILSTLMYSVMVKDFLCAFISFIFPALLNYIVLPLCLASRGTIGKVIFRLAVVNNNYIRANRLVMVGRGLFLIVVEFALSIIAMGIPLIVSFVISLFNSEGKSLHDLACFTLVLDLKDFTPFKDKEEFDKYVKNEDDFRDKSLRRPYEN